MDTFETFLKRYWLGLAIALVLLVGVVTYLNTPRRDSSETPMPRREEKQLRQQVQVLTQRADSLRVEADTARAHSQIAYAKGVEAGEEALKARLETHQPPKSHAKVPPTPTSVKHLQQYFNEY